ncbi:MAG: hypothetical protein OK454_03915, partial [Thaumarchaeota archaeon]|nr:hypothetical protein [Nitrososphaerota archaeon]
DVDVDDDDDDHDDHDDDDDDEAGQRGPHSPTRAAGHAADHLSELVASARRDRKVQDLEIRNASLEAINRTLERQLRKQTAEIRRYRRLSRSGRLSLGSVASSRIPSDATVEGPLALQNLALSDLSEEESEPEEEEEDDDDDSDDDSDQDLDDSDLFDDGGDRSPGALVRVRERERETDARHRNRDERRLQLDLSKHQQLLIDSQKINQSIKRCLGWTDELIREGRRALEYRVRVSEVALGGRVLRPEDDDEEDVGEDVVVAEQADERGGSRRDAAADQGGDDDTTRPTIDQPLWGKESQDRDSGIELPADAGG